MMCSCPPPMTDGLSLHDFAVLIERVDQHHRAQQQAQG